MNDTCPTNDHNNDSPLSAQEDAGCQPSDVPLTRFRARARFCFQGSAPHEAAFPFFPVIAPDERAFPRRSRFIRPLPCGSAYFPA